MKYLLILLLPVLIFAQSTENQKEVKKLDLQKAVELALENNNNLKQIKYDFKRAQEKVTESYGNSVLPSLDANINYQRAIKQSEFYIETPFFSGFFKQGRLNTLIESLSLRQPLFSGAMFLAVRISEIYAQMAEENYVYSKSELVANTKEIYYNAILSHEMLNVANESLKLAKENLDNSKVLHKNGLISDYDLLKAKVQYQNILPFISEAENGIILAENGLKIITGLDLKQKIQITEKLDFVPFEKIEIEDALAELYSRNKALKQLELNTELYDYQESYEFSKHFPDINLIGNLQSVAQEDDDKKFGDWTYINSSNISLSIKVPIFKGFATNSRVEQANLEFKKAQEQYAASKVNLENQVYTIINTINKDLKNIESLKLAKEQSSEGLKIAEKRYSAGLGNQLEVSDAQYNYADSKLKYLSAVRDYYVQKAKLDHLLGKN